jgi:hypothetical protein
MVNTREPSGPSQQYGKGTSGWEHLSLGPTWKNFTPAWAKILAMTRVWEATSVILAAVGNGCTGAPSPQNTGTRAPGPPGPVIDMVLIKAPSPLQSSVRLLFDWSPAYG